MERGVQPSAITRSDSNATKCKISSLTKVCRLFNWTVIMKQKVLPLGQYSHHSHQDRIITKPEKKLQFQSQIVLPCVLKGYQDPDMNNIIKNNLLSILSNPDLLHP